MNQVLIAVTAVAAAVMPVAAHATILDWNFSLDAWFEDATFEPISGTDGIGTPTTERYDLSWGSSTVRSALAIRDEGGSFDDDGAPATGSLETDLGFTLANRFFHRNRVIPLRSLALDDVTLNLDLALTPLGQTESAAVDIAPFRLDFRETPNRGPCVSGVGQCADIFSVASTTPFANGVFTHDFLFDNERYFVDLAAEGLAGLTGQQCAAVEAEDNCLGFITPENALAMTQLSLRIRSDVSEPATLGLIGLGLLGLAAARRKA